MLGEMRSTLDVEQPVMGDASRLPLNVLHIVVIDAEDQRVDDTMPMVLSRLPWCCHILLAKSVRRDSCRFWRSAVRR